MKPNKRETKLKLLRVARNALLNKRRLYVCGALDYAESLIRAQRPALWSGVGYARIELVGWINRSLGDCATYENWLVRRWGVHPRDVFDNPKLVRQRRVDWVSWMIDELEEGRDLK